MRRALIVRLRVADLADRNGSANRRSRLSGDDFQASTELRHAFSHARNAYAKPRLMRLVITVRRHRHSLSRIDDFERYACFISVQANLRSRATGMSLYIRKTFLHHAKQSRLHGLRQASKFRNHLNLSFDPAALAKSMHTFL